MSLVCLLLYLVAVYLRPHEFYPGLLEFRLLFVLGAAAGIAAVAYLPRSRASITIFQLYLMVGLVLAVPVSVILGQRWLGGGLAALQDFGITAILFFVIYVIVSSPLRFRIFVSFWVLLTAVVALQGIAAYHWGYWSDLLTITVPTDADGTMLTRIRGTGFLNDPNDLGQAIVVTFPFLALLLGSSNGLAKAPRIILLCAFAGVFLYAIYLTQSRGTFLSLGVLLLLVARRHSGRIVAAALTLVLILSAVGLTLSGGRGFSMDESLAGRMEAWDVGLQLFKAHPLFGVGYKFFRDYNELTAHNSFVLCFAELGLFGYFFWLSLILVTLFDLRALRAAQLREVPASGKTMGLQLQRYAGAVELSVYSFLISSWFLSRTYVLVLYILFGLAAALKNMGLREGLEIRRMTAPSLLRWFLLVGAGVIVVIYVSARLRPR